MPTKKSSKYATALPLILIFFNALLFLGILVDGYIEQEIPLYPLLPLSLLFFFLLSLVIYLLSRIIRQQNSLNETRQIHSGSNIELSSTPISTHDYQQLVNSANSIILRWNTEGIIQFMNPYGLNFFGFPHEDILGKNVIDTIVPRTETTGRDLVYMIEDIGKNPDDYIHNENENIKKDGSLVWITWNNKAVLDEQGKTIEILSIGNDITDKKRYEQQIYQLAHFDDLTGLANRTQFKQRLTGAINKASQQKQILPVFYIDLDRFKPINDSLGHHNGDLLLQKLATRLLHCIQQDETLARMGGDEFTVILQAKDNEQEALQSTQHVARKMLSSMSKPFNLNGHQIYITGSIGIVFYPNDGDELSILLKNADTAMYQAKQKSTNCYLYYEPHMNSEAMHNLKLETALRNAIENNQLNVHYQPSVNLRSGKIECVEALLRWQHPELGSIPPEIFIPIAEESDLILQLGSWVLKQAIAQVMQWQNKGLDDFVIAINLSMRQFTDDNLYSSIKKELNKSGLHANRLGLELTESTIMQDSEQGLETLRRLNKLGIYLFIDDFGTGYSSLSRLRDLPVHMLKIDKSFIANISEHPRHARLIDAIIAMAHNLDIRVIAEGVETQQQFDYLIQRNCDCIQGHFLSQAISAEELEKFMRATGRHFLAADKLTQS
ncbi:diguanylate cyclase/phosphodiesterase (GGDEF & EAL domains) with PAS/PAC sensor(s) [hydrothermal vent metagenome]|uniref:Diguanylate cyclase/phosphodiesterase (GGDEF & EAL domains) with PAS/PAC sensor(S) n=1 Tax=hydrothermal vent metagenome TaxID=652676 RepID=A0A3B1B7R5_9ZZZZ